MCALDQSWNVGDHKTDFVFRVANRDYAKIGFQRGERIVGDLRPSRRDARDQCGFSYVRIAYEPNISQQLQFKPIVVFFPRTPVLVLARSLVHGGGETRVAAATAAASSNHHALIGGGKIEHL